MTTMKAAANPGLCRKAQRYALEIAMVSPASARREPRWIYLKR